MIDNIEDTATASRIREGMVLLRALEAIVKNKYASNPTKLAPSTSASNDEAPKKRVPGQSKPGDVYGIT